MFYSLNALSEDINNTFSEETKKIFYSLSIISKFEKKTKKILSKHDINEKQIINITDANLFLLGMIKDELIKLKTYFSKTDEELLETEYYKNKISGSFNVYEDFRKKQFNETKEFYNKLLSRIVDCLKKINFLIYWNSPEGQEFLIDETYNQLASLEVEELINYLLNTRLDKIDDMLTRYAIEKSNLLEHLNYNTINHKPHLIYELAKKYPQKMERFLEQIDVNHCGTNLLFHLVNEYPDKNQVYIDKLNNYINNEFETIKKIDKKHQLNRVLNFHYLMPESSKITSIKHLYIIKEIEDYIAKREADKREFTWNFFCIGLGISRTIKLKAAREFLRIVKLIEFSYDDWNKLDGKYKAALQQGDLGKIFTTFNDIFNHVLIKNQLTYQNGLVY